MHEAMYAVAACAPESPVASCGMRLYKILGLITGLITTACLFCTAPARAQQSSTSPRHDGFWISVGLGPAGFTCMSCEDGAREAWSNLGGGGVVTVGGTLRQNLVVGVELLTAVHTEVAEVSENEVDPQATFVTLGAIIQFYPTRRGFFLSGGPALGLSSITGGGRLIEAPGAGFTAALGYDFRIGRKFALTPSLRYAQLFSDVAFEEGNVEERVPKNPQLWYAGWALTWY